MAITFSKIVGPNTPPKPISVSCDICGCTDYWSKEGVPPQNFFSTGPHKMAICATGEMIDVPPLYLCGHCFKRSPDWSFLSAEMAKYNKVKEN